MSFDPIKEHGHLYSSIKRVRKPPGGDCSDIFGTKPLSTPLSTPRKTDHMASNIFVPATPTPLKTGDNTINKQVTPATPTSASPRVVKDRQKSDIFFVGDKEGHNGSASPILNGRASPTIIGDSHDTASSNVNSSECVTPSGSATPPNESVNGDEPFRNALGQSAAVIGTPKKARVPPGGYSTKLW